MILGEDTGIYLLKNGEYNESYIAGEPRSSKLIRKLIENVAWKSVRTFQGDILKFK